MTIKTGQVITMSSSNEAKGPTSTTLFRMLNFELFVKPNKKVMTAGLIGISGCALYLSYMYYSGRKLAQSQYIAVTEDGSEVIQTKKSRWDM